MNRWLLPCVALALALAARADEAVTPFNGKDLTGWTARHPDKTVVFLEKTVCYCSTMNRIDLPHLVWALEELVAGRVVNQITVDADTSRYARVALDQMLALP